MPIFEDDDTDNSRDESSSSRVADGHIPTGVKKLDDENLNGYPKGTVIVVMGDERGAASLLATELAGTGVPTQYITTLRPPNYIREEVEAVATGDKDIDTSLSIDDVFRENEAPGVIKTNLSHTPEGGALIIESLNEVPWSDQGEFKEMLRKIYRDTHKGNFVSLLHLQKSNVSDLTEAERSSLNLADIVMEVNSKEVAGELEYRLLFHSHRGHNRPSEIFRLKVEETLGIDPSNEI